MMELVRDIHRGGRWLQALAASTTAAAIFLVASWATNLPAIGYLTLAAYIATGVCMVGYGARGKHPGDTERETP